MQPRLRTHGLGEFPQCENEYTWQWQFEEGSLLGPSFRAGRKVSITEPNSPATGNGRPTLGLTYDHVYLFIYSLRVSHSPISFFNLEDICKLVSVWVELGRRWCCCPNPIWLSPTGWGAPVSTSPHPSHYTSEGSLLMPFCHFPSHFPEAEKDLALWMWFMTHICKAIAFAPALANRTSNFCQKVKYLEVRGYPPLQCGSSLMTIIYGVPMFYRIPWRADT
jgi:hypothetical protein